MRLCRCLLLRLLHTTVLEERCTFWAGLLRVGDFGISGDGLVTFMSNSVASRLGDDELWVGISRRVGEFGIGRARARDHSWSLFHGRLYP